MNQLAVWVALALAASVLVAGCSSSSLQSGQEPGSEIAIWFVYDEGSPKSAAFYVCTDGNTVEIVDVKPIETVGEVEFLGAFLLAEGDLAIGSAEGFPPEGYEDVLQPMGDAVLSFRCDESPEVVAQIVVGADWAGPGGGQLNGFRVDYTANGSNGILDVPEFIVKMCGVSGEYCDG